MAKRGVKAKVAAIVPSAGKGARFGSKKKKIFAYLMGRPLLSYSLKALDSSPLIDDIILVTDRRFFKAAARLVRRYGIVKVRRIVKGGRTRSESVRNGLSFVDKDTRLVLVHDGVRPFAGKEIIRKTLAAAERYGASVSAVPVKSTIKIAGTDSFVKRTPDRNGLWEVQTPQAFRRDLLEGAYKMTKRRASFTDDAALIENTGGRVKIVKGDYRNIKITTAGDLKIAEVLLDRPLGRKNNGF